MSMEIITATAWFVIWDKPKFKVEQNVPDIGDSSDIIDSRYFADIYDTIVRTTEQLQC